MKAIAILMIMVLYFSCAESQDNQAGKKKEVEATPPKTEQTIAPDQQQPVQNRPNYIVETARPKNKIQQKFPYDIEMKDKDGNTYLSSELLKNDDGPVLLLFWLTTCFPCKMQMAKMQEVYDQWVDETGVKVIAISTDFQKNYGKFSEMVEEKDWPWECYNDWNREFRRVMPGGLNGMPQTFLLDEKGNVVYHKRKYRPGDENTIYEHVRVLAMKN